jgi:hypothetical protein
MGILAAKTPKDQTTRRVDFFEKLEIGDLTELPHSS